MAKQDYYVTLGIAKDSSKQEIKKAYRRLAHEYHPDRNSDPSAEAKFKEISEAYEILSDPQKKELYDTYGHNRPDRGSAIHHNPFDLFNSFFGGGRRQKSRNVRVELKITLEEVLTGVEKSVVYSRHIICSKCKGMGGAGSSCVKCGGYGQVEQTSPFMRVITTCPACKGRGIKITNKCSACRQGHIKEEKEITIRVPAGIESGNQIQSRGGGDVLDSSIDPGDLLCVISVKPHSLFNRRKQDLQYIQEISFTEACLGHSVKVPLLGGGEDDLKIPAGTQFGESFCLKGRGLPRVSKKLRGDLYVQIRINVPNKLKKEEKELLQQFDKKMKDRA